jgi:hypothetical protein
MSSKPAAAVAVSGVPGAGAPGLSRNERLMLNIGLKANIGLVCGGVFSMLLFKRPLGRGLFTGLSVGTGLGYAWCQNDMFLVDPVAHDTMIPKSVQAESDRYMNRVNDMLPQFAKFK